MYTLDELKTTAELMKNSSEGITNGVIRIDSPNPGPVLGITACTHGNEPAGLSVVKYLLEEQDIANTLQRGTLYLVLNNIQATDDFFAATTDEAIRKARFVNINMNRLPSNTLEDDADMTLYEVRRSRELFPVWKQFTVGLDIHSTTIPTDPMIISRGGNFDIIKNLIHGFPIEVLISNIDRIQLNVPAFAMYGEINNEIPVFAIEAGQHTEEVTFERAVACSLALLQNLEMLPGIPKKSDKGYQEYLVDASIVFPDLSYDFVSDFKSYELVHEGELLAKNPNGDELRMPFTGHLLMPTAKRGNAKDISEEVSFITRPVSVRRI